MAALAFKAGTLVLKTLAKPLANSFQTWLLARPTPRKYVVSAAQFLHRIEVNISRSAEGKSGKAFVGAMTEEKSLELAAKLASEGFILGVGLLILGVEVERQRRNDAKKQAASAEERKQLLREMAEERLEFARIIKEQSEKMHDLVRRVDGVEQRLGDHPTRSELQELQRQPTPSPRTWGGFFGPRGLA